MILYPASGEEHVIPVAARLSSLAIYGKEKAIGGNWELPREMVVDVVKKNICQLVTLPKLTNHPWKMVVGSTLR